MPFLPPRQNSVPVLRRAICIDLDDPAETFTLGGSSDCPFGSDVLKFWRWNFFCNCESVYKEVCLDEEINEYDEVVADHYCLHWSNNGIGGRCPFEF